MAKDRKKLLHIHSSVNDKQPTPASLELGELAVNNAKNNAFISTKNSDGEVVRFSEDGTLVDWMEMKEVFPYQGYVRGADDTTSGVTESDLLQNKSNIILKINQVAARNSVYSDKINGALDIYGNQVNPQDSYDYNDGAGIAIDMSRYAMIGANPSFSSVTTTDKAEFNGSSFNADVTNACVQASDTLTLGGANETNVGFSCDDNSHSDTTNIGGDIINIGAFDGASLVTENGDVSIKSINENVSINANNADIVENADIIRNNARIAVTSASSAVDIISDDDININATDKLNIHSSDNICAEAQNEAYFYGGRKTYIGVGCDGESSVDEIVYKRIPKAGDCKIQADTIDGALDEVLIRDEIHFSSSTSEGSSTYQIWQDSGNCEKRLEFTVDSTVVSMSASTNPEGETGETLTTYDLWQTIGGRRVEIGKINIPKDHLVSDVAIVYGVVTTDPQTSEQEFTPCDSAPSGSVCHWYIRMKWYVWDGSHTDKTTYLPADDFVHDIKANNDDINRGVRVDVQYNSESGVNEVSADTTLNFSTPSDVNDFTYRKYDGEHYISGTTVKFESGAFETTKYKPWSASTTVNIPTCASHIGRAKLNIEYGVNVTGKTDGAYDPGDRCDNNASATVSIPTSVEHLNRGKLTYTHNGFTSEFDPKDTVSFESPHSALTVIYESTSDKSGSVTFDTSERKSISIPTCVTHLNRHNITFQAGATSAFTSQTYDPGKDCLNAAETINIPTSVGHLNRGKLILTGGSVSNWDNTTYDPSGDSFVYIPTRVSHLNRGKLGITHNNDVVDYDPGSTDTSYTFHHSALTWTYGATSAKSGSDSFDTSAEKSISIPTDVGHLNRGKLILTGGSVSNWDSTTYDPSGNTTVWIPTCVSHLNRHKIIFQAGSTSAFSGQTYDPGKDCANSAETINIPTSMQHLEEFNGTCYLLDNDICMSSNTIVAQGFYSKSDRNLKENIASLSMIDASKADNVYFKSFNFKDDETKKKTYGVIAQDVLESGLDEIVHKDGDGTYNVDYISLLILKIASLTDKVEKLSDEIKELKEKHNQ